MFKWFRTRKMEADVVSAVAKIAPELRQLQQDVSIRLDQLQEKHDRLEAAFKSFRGQVYAWRGKLELPDHTDLSDPRLSKAEVKARLGLNTPAGAAAFLTRKQ